jgi:3-deoxy-7-phosphoheptulonate synthase
VLRDLAGQLASGSRRVVGVMVESFLLDGNQDHEQAKQLTYGQSITDKCMSWERTLPMFPLLADAVRKRRG